METFSLFVLLLFLCYVIYDDVWERRYKWDTTKQRASDASSTKRKKWRRKSKIGKRERKNKKDRTTDAPVVVVVPRGIFPFPFQRRALLRSRDPHNNVLVLVVIIVVLLLLFYIIMWSVVSSITNKTDWKMKKQKKKVLPARCLFLNHHHHHSTWYTTHKRRESKRLRDAIEEESLCGIFFIIFRI